VDIASAGRDSGGQDVPDALQLLVEDIHQVLIDRPHILFEKLPDERLRQPQGLVLKPALDARATVLRLVEDDFGMGQRFVAHGFSLLSLCFEPFGIAEQLPAPSSGMGGFSRRMASRFSLQITCEILPQRGGPSTSLFVPPLDFMPLGGLP
jgi:hypothetical protein